MLSDTTRVRLLWALIDQELPVNELAERVSKPAPSVSQHLAKLRMARLVRTRREGTQVFYRLENEHVARLVGDAVYNAEHAGPDVPRHHHHETDPPDTDRQNPGRHDAEGPARLESLPGKGSRARTASGGATA